MTDVAGISSMKARGRQNATFSSVDDDENKIIMKHNNNSTNKNVKENKKNQPQRPSTTTKVVKIMEDWNQHYIIPNRISLNKETFWFTKVEIAQIRKENYIMDQIRVHVRQKLLENEPSLKYKQPQLEDMIDEISQWEPGDIADFLQDKKKQVEVNEAEEETKGGEHHQILQLVKTKEYDNKEQQQNNTNELSTIEDEDFKDFKEADMMAQIQFHIRQKLVIQMNNNNNGEEKTTFDENLSARVKAISCWEPNKIADFLQQKPQSSSSSQNNNNPSKSKTIPPPPSKEVASKSTIADNEDSDDDSDDSDDDDYEDDPDSTTSYDSDDLSSTTTGSSSSDDDEIDDDDSSNDDIKKLAADSGIYNWDETSNEPSSSSETNNNNDDRIITRYDNVSYYWNEKERRNIPDTTTTAKTTSSTTSITPMDNDGQDILSAFSIKKKPGSSDDDDDDDNVSQNVEKVEEDDSDILEAFSFIPNGKKSTNSAVLQEDVPFDEIMEDHHHPLTNLHNTKQQQQQQQRQEGNQCNAQTTERRPQGVDDDDDILDAFSLPEKRKKMVSRDLTSKTDPEEESMSWEEKVDAIIGDIHSNTKGEKALDDTVLMPHPSPVGRDTEQMLFKVMAIMGSILAIILAIYVGKQQTEASV